MGWDICSFGKHNLDISSVENLAKQLSALLQCNIKYGCRPSIRYDEKTEKVIPKTDYHNYYIQLGTIKYLRSRKTYRLIDELYYAKQIFEVCKGNFNKLTLKIDRRNSQSYIDWFVRDVKATLKAIKQDYSSHYLIIREDWDKVKFYDPLQITITRECIMFWVKEHFRWFGFVENFTKNRQAKELRYFMAYRRGLLKIASQVNVGQIIYISDQGPTQLIIDKLWKEKWVDVMEYIKSKKYMYDYCRPSRCDSKEEKKWKREMLLEEDKFLHVNVSNTVMNNILFDDEYYLQVLFDDFKDLINPHDQRRTTQPL